MSRAIAQLMILLALSAAKVNAIQLDLNVRDPQQVGQTDRAQFGLIVNAWTEAWAISAAGGYTVTCPESQVIEAQGSTSNWRFLGNVVATLKVPPVLPGEYSMTGWAGWPLPSTQSCSFRYVARAKDGSFSIGGFGSSITYGGGDESRGDTKIFQMVKAVPRTGNGACNP